MAFTSSWGWWGATRNLHTCNISEKAFFKDSCLCFVSGAGWIIVCAFVGIKRHHLMLLLMQFSIESLPSIMHGGYPIAALENMPTKLRNVALWDTTLAEAWLKCALWCWWRIWMLSVREHGFHSAFTAVSPLTTIGIVSWGRWLWKVNTRRGPDIKNVSLRLLFHY